MQAQPHHHQHRQQQKRTRRQQTGASSPVAEQAQGAAASRSPCPGDRRTSATDAMIDDGGADPGGQPASRPAPGAGRTLEGDGGHRDHWVGDGSVARLASGLPRYGGTVSSRDVDDEFLALPLAGQLADAAPVGGACRWDQLRRSASARDHHRDRAIARRRTGVRVLDRDIGLAVQVIVNGTWGFASARRAHRRYRRRIRPPRRQGGRHAIGAERLSASNWPTNRSTATPPGSRTTVSTRSPSTADKIGVLEEYSVGCWRPTASITSRRWSTPSRSRCSTGHARIVDHPAAGQDDARAGRRRRRRRRHGSFNRCGPWRPHRPRLGSRRRGRRMGLGAELAALPELLAERPSRPVSWPDPPIW